MPGIDPGQQRVRARCRRRCPGYDLGDGPLPEDGDSLMLNLHHAAGDGISAERFMLSILRAYAGERNIAECLREQQFRIVALDPVKCLVDVKSIKETTPYARHQPVERDAHRHNVRPRQGHESKVSWSQKESSKYCGRARAKQCVARQSRTLRKSAGTGSMKDGDGCSRIDIDGR